MSRHHKARARARRAAARNAASRPSLNGSGARRLHGEQLEPRRVLAPIVVTTPLDIVDFNDGLTSLREAIFAANTVPGPDEIQFDPALITAGPATILLTHGELAITDSLTLTGPGADLLTIDASGSDPTPDLNNRDGSRILNFSNSISSTSELTVSGVTLTGGDTVGYGGAIYSTRGLTLRDAIIAVNSAQFGGGVAVTRGELVLERLQVRRNVARFVGGGILAPAIEAASISQSLIADNVASAGGGFAHQGTPTGPNGGFVTIRESTFRGNQGGGAAIGSSKGFVIMASAFVNNATGGSGGGLSVGGRHGVIEQSTISGNSSARHGGGILNSMQDSLIIRNSTIANNVADSDGRGDEWGGGLLADRTLRLENTIVTGNTLKGSIPNDVDGAGATARFSLIGYIFASSFAEAPLGAPDANGNLIGGPLHGAIDPLLAPLADNGGPTPTHALLPDSPAIDAGDAALRAGVGDTAQFDQRGEPFSRVVGARIDIGAVEQSGIPFVVDTLVDESDGDYRRGDLSLREAIELANAQPGAGTITIDPALFTTGPATILLTHGELAITDSLTITGPGANLLTIDASGSDPTPEINNRDGSRILNFSGNTLPTNASLSVSGVTLTGGDAAAEGGAIYSTRGLTLRDAIVEGNSGQRGGGLAVMQGELLLERVHVLRNVASTGGGVLGPSGDSSTLLDSTFELNVATTGGGYSHQAGPAGPVGGFVTIISSTFRANQGGGANIATSKGFHIVDSSFLDNDTAASGGGVSIIGQPGIIESSVFNGNSAARGGGIFVLGRRGQLPLITMRTSKLSGNFASVAGGGLYGGGAPISLIDCEISENRAGEEGSTEWGSGGGLHLFFGSAHIERSTISTNQATSGGGVSAYDVSDLEIQSSLVTGNSSRYGGGLNVLLGNQHLIRLRDSTVSGNNALFTGGGILISGLLGSLKPQITRSTITNNEAIGNEQQTGAGGGVLVLGTGIKLDHSIVAGNRHTLDSRVGADVFGPITEMSFTLLGQRTGLPSFPEAPIGPPDANGNLIGGPVHGAIDPLLAPLADNGGPTLTHALLPGSPAVGAGDPSFTPGQGGAPEFDQRGAPFTRLAGGRIDIGAFELQSPSGALQADFDLDGDADGNDFLQWQRNLGKTAGATVRHGDATADGDVDAQDLAVWRARFSGAGAAASDVASTARAAYPPPARVQSTLDPRTSILPPLRSTTTSPQRSVLPEQIRERLAPPRRTEFALPAPAAFDVAHQSRRVRAATRQQADDEHDADDFAAALDAAFSER
jgi:CSLREA domain-containing protein